MITRRVNGAWAPVVKPSFPSEDDDIVPCQKKTPAKRVFWKNEKLKHTNPVPVRTSNNKANAPTCTSSNVHILKRKQIRALKSQSVQHNSHDNDIDLGWYRIAHPSFPPTLGEIPWNSKITGPSFPHPDQTPYPKTCKNVTTTTKSSFSNENTFASKTHLKENSKTIDEVTFKDDEKIQDGESMVVQQGGDEEKVTVLIKENTEQSPKSSPIKEVSNSSPVKQGSNSSHVKQVSSPVKHVSNPSPVKQSRSPVKQVSASRSPLNQLTQTSPIEKDSKTSSLKKALVRSPVKQQVSVKSTTEPVPIIYKTPKHVLSTRESPAAEYVKRHHVPQVSKSSPFPKYSPRDSPAAEYIKRNPSQAKHTGPINKVEVSNSSQVNQATNMSPGNTAPNPSLVKEVLNTSPANQPPVPSPPQTIRSSAKTTSCHSPANAKLSPSPVLNVPHPSPVQKQSSNSIFSTFISMLTDSLAVTDETNQHIRHESPMSETFYSMIHLAKVNSTELADAMTPEATIYKRIKEQRPSGEIIQTSPDVDHKDQLVCFNTGVYGHEIVYQSQIDQVSNSTMAGTEEADQNLPNGNIETTSDVDHQDEVVCFNNGVYGHEIFDKSQAGEIVQVYNSKMAADGHAETQPQTFPAVQNPARTDDESQGAALSIMNRIEVSIVKGVAGSGKQDEGSGVDSSSVDLGWHPIKDPSFPPTVYGAIPWNAKISQPSFVAHDNSSSDGHATLKTANTDNAYEKKESANKVGSTIQSQSRRKDVGQSLADNNQKESEVKDVGTLKTLLARVFR